MSERLNHLMKNACPNYILPFLWLHGEDEQTLRKEVLNIYKCGITAFCVESRPHPDFVGEKWWQDMDILIDEAKKNGMKIWILDDSHFPTGPAAGYAATCALENRKTVLGYRWIDVCGPLLGSSFIPPHDVDVDSLKYIVARRIDGNDESIDITKNFISGRLYFDVPDGLWRIYYYYINSDCIHLKHINHLREGGAKVLIDAVYEPHYSRYKDEFGKTIAGFFSDEPGFYSCETGHDSYERKLGDEHFSLSWDKDMANRLTDCIGRPICEILPALSDNSAMTEIIRSKYRYEYMNILTTRYDKCFCSVIGDWCRAHGVEYMGHIIEDNNSHSNSGLSVGHFFRGMYGQDYSGSDVVLHQILPGMDDIDHAAFTGFYANSLSEGEFYSYSLYHMATSLAQIDSKKKGRTMCEVFGAYGWGEGTKLMKWMADFLLVRGVNRFVPHAFSSKAFPDEDCPPHFYAHGKNPQFEGFKKLMKYMNRTAHLLDGGHHAAEIAIIYDGENAWSSDDIMRSQKIGKVLTKEQLQYDIIPFDAVRTGKPEKNRLVINTQKYSVIIIPYSHYMLTENEQALSQLAKNGVKIIFAESYPQLFLDTGNQFTFKEQELYILSKLSDIAETCKKIICPDIVVTGNTENLHTYVYKHSDSTVFMLVNSHPSRTVSANISLTPPGDVYEYDAYNGKVYKADKDFTLTLHGYESRIYIITETFVSELSKKTDFSKQLYLDNVEWTVKIAEQEHYPEFTFYEKTNTLVNYNTPEHLPDFSGIIRYETEINLENPITGEMYFTGVSESVQLFINDNDMGMCIAPPYCLNVELNSGKNKIAIETRNTLYNKVNDIFSRYLPIEATGITGKIIIK